MRRRDPSEPLKTMYRTSKSIPYAADEQTEDDDQGGVQDGTGSATTLKANWIFRWLQTLDRRRTGALTLTPR